MHSEDTNDKFHCYKHTHTCVHAVSCCCHTLTFTTTTPAQNIAITTSIKNAAKVYLPCGKSAVRSVI